MGEKKRGERDAHSDTRKRKKRAMKEKEKGDEGKDGKKENCEGSVT